MKKILSAVISIMIIGSSYIYCAESQSDVLTPFKLLFKPECKNSIIIYGVNTRSKEDKRKKDIISEDHLLMFAKNGIDAYQPKIEKNNLRIFISPNCIVYEQQKVQNRKVLLYKKSKSGKMTTYLRNNSKTYAPTINDRTRIVYHIPWYDNDFQDNDYAADVYAKLADNTAPCLLLIDMDLLKKYDNIENKIYDRFKGTKNIITFNPYFKEISTQDKYATEDLFPSLYLGGLALLGLIYYYNPEIGRYVNPLQHPFSI